MFKQLRVSHAYDHPGIAARIAHNAVTIQVPMRGDYCGVQIYALLAILEKYVRGELL
jgi:hypothetical protein